jgi:hypothetical protein
MRAYGNDAKEWIFFYFRKEGPEVLGVCAHSSTTSLAAGGLCFTVNVGPDVGVRDMHSRSPTATPSQQTRGSTIAHRLRDSTASTTPVAATWRKARVALHWAMHHQDLRPRGGGLPTATGHGEHHVPVTRAKFTHGVMPWLFRLENKVYAPP